MFSIAGRKVAIASGPKCDGWGQWRTKAVLVMPEMEYWPSRFFVTVMEISAQERFGDDNCHHLIVHRRLTGCQLRECLLCQFHGTFPCRTREVQEPDLTGLTYATCTAVSGLLVVVPPSLMMRVEPARRRFSTSQVFFLHRVRRSTDATRGIFPPSAHTMIHVLAWAISPSLRHQPQNI